MLLPCFGSRHWVALVYTRCIPFWMELNLKCARECSLCTSARSTHYAYGISLGLVEVKTSEMHVLCRNCLTLRFSCYCIAVLASTVCIEQINFCLRQDLCFASRLYLFLCSVGFMGFSHSGTHKLIKTRKIGVGWKQWNNLLKHEHRCYGRKH